MLGGVGLIIALTVYVALRESDVAWQRGIGQVAGVWAALSITVYAILVMIALWG